MSCPYLEETSALFDGRVECGKEGQRQLALPHSTHAHSCAECRAFLADAAVLRENLVILSWQTARNAGSSRSL